MSTEKQCILQVTGLSVSYQGIPALRDVEIRVDQGEAVSILGTNGAGKSTLLNTIAGLIRPGAGTALLRGEPLPFGSPEKCSRLGLALVPEGRHVYPELTVLENLQVGMWRCSRSDRHDRIEVMLETFPALRALARRLGGSLSGGEQQQLVIARALLTDPDLILLDEPSLGLSPVMMDVVFDAIDSLTSQGVAVLLVEQNAGRALEVTERAYGMHRGQIAFERPSSALSGDQLENFYLGAAV